MTYTSKEHLHNFACWTAAAAVRRGFFKNELVAKAINASNLPQFRITDAKSEESYHQYHREVCSQIQKELKKEVPAASFGQAAKIVAIYLKTSAVIPNMKNPELIEHIFPPIDRILITNLKKYLREKGKPTKALTNYNWTQATSEEYDALRNSVIENGLKFNWELECFWDIYKADN